MGARSAPAGRSPEKILLSRRSVRIRSTVRLTTLLSTPAALAKARSPISTGPQATPPLSETLSPSSTMSRATLTLAGYEDILSRTLFHKLLAKSQYHRL